MLGHACKNAQISYRKIKESPAATYSPAPFRRGTIGGGRLNFRVRDGDGCVPPPVAAEENFLTMQREIIFVQCHIDE